MPESINTMDPGNPNITDNEYSSKGYALSGRIMLSAIIILFFVVIMMVCLHLYARWYLLNARRRQLRRARNRRSHLIFYVDPSNPTAHVIIPSRGLDATVLKTLPVFVYSSNTHPGSIECAVCLSEFEENETGRTLPKCNHRFHIQCIDMWFHSHSTCPICRSSVEPLPETTLQVNSEVNVTGSSSGLCVTCQQEENPVDVVASTSSFHGRSKPAEFAGVTIEVPRRNGSFDDEPATESPSSYRSPMSRMLSFRRILSREKRGTTPSASSANTPASCGGGSSTELDETSQTQGKLDSDSIV